MNTTTAQSPGFKYWAFISYSHQDNLKVRGDGSGDHIPWANWLHEQLETFRLAFVHPLLADKIWP